MDKLLARFPAHQANLKLMVGCMETTFRGRRLRYMKLGFYQRLSGIGLLSCPYKAQGSRKDWQYGWMEADTILEEKQPA